MTDSSRFQAALAISFFLHFMLLNFSWPGFSARQGQGGLAQDFSSGAAMVAETFTVSLEAVGNNSERAGLNERERERRRYVDEIVRAIHSRRFISARAKAEFIGLASFSFIVDCEGNFKNIRLESGSGNSELDEAAEEAVRGSSGTAKRPHILGAEEIFLIVPVKYQYSW